MLCNHCLHHLMTAMTIWWPGYSAGDSQNSTCTPRPPKAHKKTWEVLVSKQGLPRHHLTCHQPPSIPFSQYVHASPPPCLPPGPQWQQHQPPSPPWWCQCSQYVHASPPPCLPPGPGFDAPSTHRKLISVGMLSQMALMIAAAINNVIAYLSTQVYTWSMSIPCFLATPPCSSSML